MPIQGADGKSLEFPRCGYQLHGTDGSTGGPMALRYRYSRGWLGAGILIAVGVIGLAANFDLLPPHILSQFWKLWPLIPLGIGLSILFGRRGYPDGRNPRDIDHP